MRTRLLALLLALGSVLMACTSTPEPTPKTAAWDQSNFETANWN